MTGIGMVSLVALPLNVLVDMGRYVFQDWEFAKWICIAVALDTALGLVKAWQRKDISSEEFGNRFFRKIGIYIALMILSNVLTNMRVHGSVVRATEWVGEYLCTFMIVREAISILENVNAIMPIVPAWFLARLKDFTEKGEYMGRQPGKEEDEEDEEEEDVP